MSRKDTGVQHGNNSAAPLGHLPCVHHVQAIRDVIDIAHARPEEAPLVYPTLFARTIRLRLEGINRVAAHSMKFESAACEICLDLGKLLVVCIVKCDRDGVATLRANRSAY